MNNVLLKESGQLSIDARDIKITDQEDMEIATDVLTGLNQNLKNLKAEKEKITKPLNDALKAERARWKPFEDQLVEAVAHVRSEMSRYQTEQQNKADEAESRLAARMEKGTIKPETAIKRLRNIDQPVAKVEGSQGKLSFRTTHKVHVVDIKKVPAEYLFINETRIKDAYKAGVSIPGVKIEEVQTPINRS